MSSYPSDIDQDGRSRQSSPSAVLRPSNFIEPIASLPPAERRKAAADTIEALIELLDTTDGDPDLEDGHDAEDDRADSEPSLGWCSAGAVGGSDDREEQAYIGTEVAAARARMRSART